jgi:beta-lactamase superfamily II metal-dependent hydrolase
MKILVACISTVLLLTMSFAVNAQKKTLEIYFIDVEGGQATLLVAPSGESLLVDTGYAGNGTTLLQPGNPNQARDAKRIVAAAHDAGIIQIDNLLITHFHSDHDGGVTELAQLMPIRTFIDHGSVGSEAERNVPGTMDAFNAYAAVRKRGRHLEPKPGDRIPLKGVDVTVVSSAMSILTKPLPAANGLNSACSAPPMPAQDPNENPRSTGIVVQFGQFRFLDVGDLTGPPLYSLACPNDLIGPVDAYLVAHHGGPDADVEATFAAFKPRIAIMNNGAKKGGALLTYEALHRVQGLEDVWQVHRSEAAGKENFAENRIANLDEGSAHWIKLIANNDGSFRVQNGRTRKWQSYGPR